MTSQGHFVSDFREQAGPCPPHSTPGSGSQGHPQGTSPPPETVWPGSGR